MSSFFLYFLAAAIRKRTRDSCGPLPANSLSLNRECGLGARRTGRILGSRAYGSDREWKIGRIEEYLLFLYSHRYHDHTRGSWTAGEVAGIDGDNALFCIPAQLTIPLLVRWMLVLEDSEEDRLYFAKGLPREWVGSGKEIKIEGAPTRWGRVSLKMAAHLPTKTIKAKVELARPGSPKEVQVTVRVPKNDALRGATVNGHPAIFGGVHNDTVIIATGNEKHFEVTAQFT